MGIFDRKKTISEQPANEIGKIKLPIQERYLERITKDISKWRTAQEDAEVLDYPDRQELMKIYKDLMDDSQIFSCTQIRTNKSTNGKIWIYDENNEINEKISKLFVDSKGLPLPWLRSFFIIAQKSKYYGNTCAQVYKDKDFVVKEVPPENLVPQWDGFIVNIESGFTRETNFYPYDHKQYGTYLFPVGNNRDLGLLNKCAPYMIWKEVFGSWSMHADIFGQPLRVGKTNIRDAERRKNMLDMLAGMVKSTYTVIDTDDLVEFVESGKGDPHAIYKELINACDQAISKILLGGTGMTDEKSFVGSAEIQYSILGSIVMSDKLDLAQIVNEQLIPRFIKLGYLPEGNYNAVWDMDETLTIEKWATVISQLSMAGYKMSIEDVENKLGIEIEDMTIEEIPFNEPDKGLTEAISKMYNLYKDYE